MKRLQTRGLVTGPGVLLLLLAFGVVHGFQLNTNPSSTSSRLHACEPQKQQQEPAVAAGSKGLFDRLPRVPVAALTVLALNVLGVRFGGPGSGLTDW